MQNLRHLRNDILEILKSAIETVRGDNAVRDRVRLSAESLEVGSHSIDLDEYERIFVIGAGKATAYMALGLEELLDDRITEGLVSVKYGHSVDLRHVRLIEAGHPTPDENSVLAARSAIRLARSCHAGDLVFCLLSGGASSLWCLPSEPLRLADKIVTTQALLRCGATIHEMNTVRKHLSDIKGGRLARAVSPARLISLAISDVIGDDMSAIGSGPTVTDPTTFQDSWTIAEKYNLLSALPDTITIRLRNGIRGLTEETLKPGESVFNQNIECIVASNKLALQTAQKAARELGYTAQIISTDLCGEARQVGKELLRRAKQASAPANEGPQRVMLLAGGETTVTVKGHGKGGRNQELALAAAIELDGVENVVLASAGTDGTDGPTDAAGAIVDGSTVRRGQKSGMCAASYLADSNSYEYFDKLGDLIRTGPTGTNVMDLQIIVVIQ